MFWCRTAMFETKHCPKHLTRLRKHAMCNKMLQCYESYRTQRHAVVPKTSLYFNCDSCAAAKKTVCATQKCTFRQFLHCTIWDEWWRSSAQMQWWESRRSTYLEKPRAEVVRSIRDRQTDHRCCWVTYECHPPRQQRRVAWRKMQTCPWYSDSRSECLSPEHTTPKMSQKVLHFVIVHIFNKY